MAPVSIEAAIEQERKREEYRKRYNKEPKVVQRRQMYNKLRQEETKLARQVMNGDITLDQGNEKLATLREQYEEELKELNGSITLAPQHTNVEASASAPPPVKKNKKSQIPKSE